VIGVRFRMRLCAVMFFFGVAVTVTADSATGERVLDDFDDIGLWHVATSDDVEASLRSAPGSQGNALCMDFDFGTVSGYAVARRALPLDYGDNYELSFGLRGDAPVNSLQFKLVDETGQNVWWVNRPDYAFPRDWQRVRFKKRHISFAWGPTKDRELKHSAQIELVVARGRGGGKGTVCFDHLTFRELPADGAVLPTPVLRATSTLPPSEPAQALDGIEDTAWRSDPAAGADQMLIADFQQPREFGGLVLHWLRDAYASRYTIDFSDDGVQWRTVRRVTDGNGGSDPHLLPESETRFVRVHLQDGPAKAYGLAEIEIKDLSFGASANAFIEAIAKDASRGTYPRAFVGQQSYWTIVGVDGGPTPGLFSEDGALEIAPQLGSIEPFLLTDEGLVTWADVTPQQSLLEGYLPIPSVTWDRRDVALRVTAFATGTRERSQLLAEYRVENRSDRSRTVTLALAIRPFQVSPPMQFLSVQGGVSPLRELSWDGHVLSIDGERRVFPLVRPDRVFAADFDAGNVPELLAQAAEPRAQAVTDETGFASAALLYRLKLPPHKSRSIGIVAPLTGAATLPKDHAIAWLKQQQSDTADAWRRKLNRVTLHLPGAGKAVEDGVRTALAHILISRDGPALRPGTRSYARSWIRDGAMMSDALLRLGQTDVVRDYAEWFASHQFGNGKVPCCVDARGSDPVAENDSNGELIHLIAQHYRYAGDHVWLQHMWPEISSAVEFMNALRATQRTASNETDERRALYGLMPASISHEGYSDRPAYSYWDDFWSLAGYASAADSAKALKRDNEAARLAAQRDEFGKDVAASLRASIAQHGIDYIPASADRGDFDPTSTTVALSVAGQQAALPQPELDQTFERYWKELVARRDGATDWDAYTPYEFRNIGAFVRLGWRERASESLDFFLRDRRPLNWNQWPEVVGRDARRPRFLGDLPHAWVASDFIQSVLDMFAYVRAEDQTLVVGAGIPIDWLAGSGIEIKGLRTPYGKLSYSLRRERDRLLLKVSAGVMPPPGGLIFAWPHPSAPGNASMNGRPTHWDNRKELRIRTLPATIAIEAEPAP
jgi:hypothetical protein